MTIDERIPGLSDKDLATLHANAMRLAGTGVARQKLEAERILPLIDAEVAERKARAPSPAARMKAVRAQKTAGKATAKTATKTAAKTAAKTAKKKAPAKKATAQ